MNHIPPSSPAQTPEPFADICLVPVISPYGVRLQFGAVQGQEKPPAGQAAPAQQKITETARVNMSLEHWKVLAFSFARDVLRYEKETHYEITVPDVLLKGLNSTVEEWRKFWYGWVTMGQPYGPTVLKDGNTAEESKPVAPAPNSDMPVFPFGVKK